MSDFTDAAENKIIDMLLRGRGITTPTTGYIALFTASPGETGSVANEVSAAGTGYARASFTPSDTAFEATQGGSPSAASSGTTGATQNVNAINFPTATADWGTVTHWAYIDNNGVMWIYKALTNSRFIAAGSTPSFAAGALDIVVA